MNTERRKHHQELVCLTTFCPIPLYVCLSTELQNSGEMDMEGSCPIAGERATAFIEELNRRIGGLGRHPHLGRVPRNAALRSAGYRILVLGSSLVFYRIQHSAIEIHRVVHGFRDLDHLL